MTPKTFKENLKMGNVSEIEIVDRFTISVSPEKSCAIFFKLRNHLYEYQLDRYFLTIISAAKFVISCIDKPIIDGLSPLYQAIPPIRIIKTHRGGTTNEKDQHEPPSKSEEFQERLPYPS